jgi:hypothetical protein
VLFLNYIGPLLLQEEIGFRIPSNCKSSVIDTNEITLFIQDSPISSKLFSQVKRGANKDCPLYWSSVTARINLY